jgi:hypothetical protein
VFDNVVFGETIKVDSSTIPAEKNAAESQEISQRFCEVIYTLDCLDEGVYGEIPAITITGTSYSQSLASGIKGITAYMYPWFASAFKAGQGERRSDGLGGINGCEVEVEDMFNSLALAPITATECIRLPELFRIDRHDGCTYPWPGSNRATTTASRMDRTRR